jgi:hypothetical protein
LREKGLNLLLFFAIWAIIWLIPIPPRKFSITSKRRLLFFTVGLFLFGLNVLALTPLSLFVYFLVFSRIIAVLVEHFILPNNTSPGYHDVARIFESAPQIQSSLRRRKGVYGFLLVVVLLISFIGLIAYGEIQRVSNARYFNGFIAQGFGLPFDTTPPDNMVRLVTKELAYSIARRHMSEFGSNTQVLDCHVTKSPEGSLVWVATVASTNVIAENYIKGFILIDAAEPTATPQIMHAEFAVGEGLWWDRDIAFRNPK